jgi:hypothetical protein
MKENITLDEWDCRVIHLFKNWDVSPENPLTLVRLKEIWAERNGLEIEDVPIDYITEHFLGLARNLDLFNNDYRFNQFILDLDKKNNYKFLCSSNGYLTKDTDDFQLILLSRLDSLFSLTEVSNLPGYKEFSNKD